MMCGSRLAAQEPALYRLYEALNHNGHSLKALINEKFGDGIMSAIDFYMSVDKMTGLQGEDRVVITMNGRCAALLCWPGHYNLIWEVILGTDGSQVTVV